MFVSADSIKSFLLTVQVAFLLIMFLLTEIESADSSSSIPADYVSAGHVL
ncbi:hypothetical protein Tco_0436936, partial [Tanacetum coccineum]